MKKTLSITLACLSACIISAPLFAQETVKVSKSRSNIQNNRTCVVKFTPIADGCEISFNHEVTSPRDPASGLATGKRQHKPFNFIVSSLDNTITEVKSPRDVATGQSSGKRSADFYLPVVAIKGGKIPGGTQFNKIVVENGEFTMPDCPDGDYDMIMSWSWGATNSGSSKRCTAGFTLTMENGACMAINTKGTGASSK